MLLETLPAVQYQTMLFASLIETKADWSCSIKTSSVQLAYRSLKAENKFCNSIAKQIGTPEPKNIRGESPLAQMTR